MSRLPFYALFVLTGTAFAQVPGAPPTYSIDVRQEFRGNDVVVTSSVGDPAVITLENRASEAVTCRVEFTGGLMTPNARTVTIHTGERATVTQRIGDRDLRRLDVFASCDKGDRVAPPNR